MDGIEDAAATPAKKTRAPARRASAKAPKRKKAVRWSAKREGLFVQALGETSNIAASCRAAGLSESTVRRRRSKDAEFAARWAAALREGFEKLETMLLDRALNGMEKPVWHGGKQVGTLRVSALGPGDGGVAATASAEVIGRAVRPPPPVHLAAARLGDGTIRFGWTRVSRQGWAWLDGGDAPLGEDGERYRLRIVPSAGSARTVETGLPSYDYAPADQAGDGAATAASIAVELVQLGTNGASPPPATARWTL